MNDIVVHLLLFTLVSAAIVMMSAFFSEQEDRRALASFPKRVLVFVLGCSVLAALLLAVESTFASID